jgi:hypothetical protein
MTPGRAMMQMSANAVTILRVRFISDLHESYKCHACSISKNMEGGGGSFFPMTFILSRKLVIKLF